MTEEKPGVTGSAPARRRLSDLCEKPMEPGRFLELAISITAALQEAHRSHVTHGNLDPYTILIDTGTGTAELPSGKGQPAPPYMSPEQTGRVSLPADQRSDLYSLGVIFYQMLTAALPCDAHDLLEWVHCHIAREPRPLQEMAPESPSALTPIVIKLLAKDPDDRYQSASGLKWDLERCLSQWVQSGAIAPFPLGERDLQDHLVIPGRLYGREDDKAALLGAFQGILESGRPELLLVAGYSGIGKTSLVRELHLSVTREGGYFVSGKFDQYRRHIPYSTIAQAFRELMRHILSESEEQIARWRKEIRDAVGINGQLLVDLVPELELVIGTQPKVPELPPADAENRFKLFFRKFVAVFATREHPLVVFLDDLQWPDPGSLKLVSDIMTHREEGHLLLIGAYRDNEVDPSHPLMLHVAELEKRGYRARTITLTPLSPDDLARLIADTLRTRQSQAEPLTRLVHEKTAGNPFFVVQFLKELYSERLVWFDAADFLWKWDVDRIREKGYTDNVADLMTQKLKKLPQGTLHEIELAACIGNRFDLRTLAIISELSEQETGERLRDAVQEGLLLLSEGGFSFTHDRVQESAYALVPEQDRPGLHLRIGRLMLAQLTERELEDRILDVVNQLNQGVDLIQSQQERERVAELDLVAARRARDSSAYLVALYYAGVASGLLGSSGWEGRYDLAFGVELLLAECEYLTGELDAARERLTGMFARGLDLVDSSAVTCLLIDLFTTQSRADFAVEAGLGYLRRGGIDWSAHPEELEVRQEFERLWNALGNREIEELLDLPLMEEPGWRAVMDVLARMLPPTLFTDRNLCMLVICRMANLSLNHGNSDGSALAYVWLGAVLGPKFHDFPRAYRFGKLGFNLVEQRGLDRYKARVYLDYSHVINPWNIPMRSGPPLVWRALEVASERGDLTFMTYSSCNLITALLAAGLPLAEVQDQAEKRLEFCRKARFDMISGIIEGQLGLIRQLRGESYAFASFDSAGFDQARYERHLEQDPAMAVARAWYWVRKLEGAFFAGDLADARRAAGMMKGVMWTMPSHMEVAEFTLFAALTCCALYPELAERERASVREELRGYQQQFRRWEDYFPENFSCPAALVDAEIARIEGREHEAELLYEKALHSAGGDGFLNNQGLAYDLASRFHRARGFDRFADTYLCHAVSCYRRWGAAGKIRHLEEQFPLLKERLSAASIGDIDAITVVKASQAISQQIHLSNLLHTLMRIVLENAGARKGVLVLLHGDDATIEARAAQGADRIEVALKPETPMPQLLPVSVLNYVRHTGERVILEDASDPTQFAADDYIKEQKPLSVLCLPLLRQSEMVGLLYLENELVRGAFTAGRVAILEALAAQAAISLENARLYEAYRELSETLELRVKQAVEELAQKNRVLVLQSRQAIMGEMLGNIAHQWRQPLNTLALLAQELQMTQRFDTLTKEGLETNVKKTMEIIQHMSKTIDDFRHFFRPEKEKVQFRLLEVLEKALSLLEGTFQAYGITVETVAAGDPVLEGYPNEYSQVLLNILNNAKDAFQSRKTAEPKVVITVGEEGERSAVSIADNAGGIPESIIDKIFDLYFTTKGPEQGTGVGLFMCKSIIEKNMHGSLTVRNTGVGAEFLIKV